MTRVCFQLRIAPEHVDEYRERHAAVWPTMLDEIHVSGRRNYSLFLGDDGLLIGYYEVEDRDAADRFLAASATAARWEADMAALFDGLEGRADQQATELTEIFNLDMQRSAAKGR